MISLIHAELRKIFSVRSTYFIIFLAFVVNALIAGFGKGYLSSNEVPSNVLVGSGILQDAILIAVNITAIFGALIALLLITHEYRYNTILYSLTSSRSRTQFLAAKVLAVILLSLTLTTALACAAPLFTWIGVHISGHSLPAQSIAYGNIYWRVLFYGWGNAIIGLLFGALIRNQIGAIMTFFLIPSTVEGLLSLILKDNSAYLPFTLLSNVLIQGDGLGKSISYGHAAALFSLYMVGGWLVAWLLFLRRDAN